MTPHVYGGDDKLSVWMHCVNHLKRRNSFWWCMLHDWTVHALFCCYIMNMYMAHSVSVSLHVLMCVVVCELSQTPPDLCLCRLISAVHKGGLCALQDRLSGQWIPCLTTPSHTQANWYAPLPTRDCRKPSLSALKVIIEWQSYHPSPFKTFHQIIHLEHTEDSISQ